MLKALAVVCVMAVLAAITSFSWVYFQQPQTVEWSQISRNDVGQPTYKNELFTGEAISYYASGQMSSADQFVNGQRHGYRKQWFENGVLSREMHYENAGLQGHSKSWWRSGDLRSVAYYEDGKREGVSWNWYETGALFKKSTHEAGRASGLQQAWTKNGDLFANYEYKNGRVYGLQKAKTCVGVEDETISPEYYQNQKS